MQCRAAGALLPYHTPSPRRFLLCQLPLGHFKSLQIWPHVSHSRTCLAHPSPHNGSIKGGVLALDEPTANLDAANIRGLAEALSLAVGSYMTK